MEVRWIPFVCKELYIQRDYTNKRNQKKEIPQMGRALKLVLDKVMETTASHHPFTLPYMIFKHSTQIEKAHAR